MIPQRNLSLLSNRLARKGGRRLPEVVLERNYCLPWFLVGFSNSPLRERLAFKGETAIKRCYFGEYRFSEDLDFTQLADVPFEAIRTELDAVFEDVHRSSGIVMRYEREDCQTHANSHTFYLAYEGPLPARSAKEVKVDITIRERLVLPLAGDLGVGGHKSTPIAYYKKHHHRVFYTRKTTLSHNCVVTCGEQGKTVLLPQPHWLLHVPRIIGELRRLPVPVLDRATIEKLFGLKRRQAILLLHRFGGYQAGRTFLLDCQELVEQLEAIRDGETFSYEQRRRRRHFTQVDQVHQLVSASEADPEIGFMEATALGRDRPCSTSADAGFCRLVAHWSPCQP